MVKIGGALGAAKAKVRGAAIMNRREVIMPSSFLYTSGYLDGGNDLMASQ